MNKAKLNKLFVLLIPIIFTVIAVTFGFIEKSLSLLTYKGFSQEIIYFLLIIPFILLLISFLKVIVGLTINDTLSIILIILSAFMTGPLFTFLVLVFSLIIGYLAKSIIITYKLHFAVTSSIILSILFIGLLLFLPIINQYAHCSTGNNNFVIICATLLTVNLNDRYFSFKMTKNLLRKILRNFASTTISAYFCYFLLGGSFILNSHIFQFSNLQEIIKTYPDLIFIALLLQILIGRYTGLRLTEVIRFRKILFKTR